MPSPKKPLKRDLLKQELADKLQVDVSDILERPEAATILGYRNPKTLSNQKHTAPCYYLGDLGKEGMALYSRPDLIRWRDDPEYKRAMDKLGSAGRPLPWPDTEVHPFASVADFCRKLGMSEEEIEEVLAR